MQPRGAQPHGRFPPIADVSVRVQTSHDALVALEYTAAAGINRAMFAIAAIPSLLLGSCRTRQRYDAVSADARLRSQLATSSNKVPVATKLSASTKP